MTVGRTEVRSTDSFHWSATAASIIEGRDVILMKLKPILAILKELAPYAAIELILPGGTIIAILLWLYRRRRAATARVPAQQRVWSTQRGMGCRTSRTSVFSLLSARSAHIASQISHGPCAWEPFRRSSASSSAS